MSTVTASQARTEWPALLDRVEAGDEVVITRYGRVVAVVIRPDSLRARRAEAVFAKAEELRVRMENARNVPLSEVEGISEEYADELVARIRADRDSS